MYMVSYKEVLFFIFVFYYIMLKIVIDYNECIGGNNDGKKMIIK